MNTSNDTILCGHSVPYSAIQANLRVFGNIPTILVGLLTNSLSICIFRHKRMRSSLINWFLLSLAISDQIVLFSTFFMLSFPVLAEWSGTLATIELSNYMTRWAYPLGQISQTSGVYLTVFVSIYRYLGVCHPFMTQRLITPTKIQMGIFCAFLTAFLFNGTRWWEIRMVSCLSLKFNTTSLIVYPGNVALDPNYFLYYRVYAYTMVMFAVPFAVLIVVNSFIIVTLHQSRNFRRVMTMRKRSTRLGPRQSKQEKRKQDHDSKENSTTLMLLAVVCLFLLCNSLAFINNIIEISKLTDKIGYQLFTILVEIGNLLVTLNSAATFYIYSIFSTKFRLLLKVMLVRSVLRKSTEITNDYMPLSTMVQGATPQTSLGSKYSPVHLYVSKKDGNGPVVEIRQRNSTDDGRKVSFAEQNNRISLSEIRHVPNNV